MRSKTIRRVLFIAFFIFAGVGLLRMKEESAEHKIPSQEARLLKNKTESPASSDSEIADIYSLTAEKEVIAYLRKHNRLPDYYISKKEARESGWLPDRGNLCEVLPGKAIGGDNFANREKLLPEKKDRSYYEADINYNCGRRGAERLVYSSDGLIFITKNHYKSFEKR